MYTLIGILIFIVCLLLIGIILIQESKGGGLSSGFASTNQVMGVKKTGDFLERATWSLAIGLLVLSLVAAAVQAPQTVTSEEQKSEIQDFIQNEPILPPAGMENNPAPMPVEE